MKIEEFIKENDNFDIKKYNRESQSAVYFICEKDGVIIYIGSTTDLVGRLREHASRKEFYDKPVFFFFCDKETYQDIEKQLILQIKPEYNVYSITKPKPKKECNPIIKSKIAIKIKNKLIAVMAERNISVKDLAETIGITYPCVYQLINVKSGMQLRTVKKLEQALPGCNLSVLIF